MLSPCPLRNVCPDATLTTPMYDSGRDTGQTGKYGQAYGHLGATYGFQSQLVYFPALEFALAVATNIESNSQTQPKDTLCFAYNALAGLMLGKDIDCRFGKSSYYGSGCNCTQIENAPHSVDRHSH